MSEKNPTWMNRSVSQWEKASELALKNNEVGEALKYADYANCREMHENGMSIEKVQNRFGGNDD